jgi:hypothetical protein
VILKIKEVRLTPRELVDRAVNLRSRGVTAPTAAQVRRRSRTFAVAWRRAGGEEEAPLKSGAARSSRSVISAQRITGARPPRPRLRGDPRRPESGDRSRFPHYPGRLRRPLRPLQGEKWSEELPGRLRRTIAAAHSRRPRPGSPRGADATRWTAAGASPIISVTSRFCSRRRVRELVADVRKGPSAARGH